MIAKIKKGKFFQGAIRYNEKKVEEGTAFRLCCIGFDMDDPRRDEVLKEFLGMEKMCPIKYPVFHTSLNFAPEENFDDRTLENIAHDYMREMGYDKTPYVVYKHTDAGHLHIHIVSSNITINTEGKYKGIDTYLDWVRSNRVSAEIEQKYNLVVSVDQGKKKKQDTCLSHDNEPNINVYGQTPTFAYLKQVTDFILTNRLFTDLRELNQILKSYHVRAYSNVSRSGNSYYKFSCIDVNDSLKGVSGTAKQLKLHLNKEQISRLFYENGKKLEVIRPVIQDLRSKYIAISKADLARVLNTYSMQNIALLPLIPQISSLLPDGFIQNITVKREYFKAFLRTVTEFRKRNRIYHESTLIKNPDLMVALESFAITRLNSLRPAQVKILYKYYADYKQKTIERVEYNEYVRDRNWLEKAIGYMNQLAIPYVDKELLLARMGIVFQDDHIELSNPTDSVKHIIPRVAVLQLEGDQNGNSQYERWIGSLTNAEVDYIRSCIGGRRRAVNINTSNLAPFLVVSITTSRTERKTDTPNRKSRISSLLPDEYDLKEGKRLHWEDNEEEDEEEEDLPKRKPKLKL